MSEKKKIVKIKIKSTDLVKKKRIIKNNNIEQEQEQKIIIKEHDEQEDEKKRIEQEQQIIKKEQKDHIDCSAGEISRACRRSSDGNFAGFRKDGASA